MDYDFRQNNQAIKFTLLNAGMKFLFEPERISTMQKNKPLEKRLNVDEEHELLDWTERYGVSADRIREAVRVVGNRVSDVVKYLMDGPKTQQLSRS